MTLPVTPGPTCRSTEQSELEWELSSRMTYNQAIISGWKPDPKDKYPSSRDIPGLFKFQGFDSGHIVSDRIMMAANLCVSFCPFG